MLDKRTAILLDKINDLCREGSYKIVDEEDLVSCFPARMKADADGVRQMLEYLSDHRYVDIKYAEDGVFCLSPLPEGRLYTEKAHEARSDRFRRRRDVAVLTALGAFIGAFAGSLAAWLISALL